MSITSLISCFLFLIVLLPAVRGDLRVGFYQTLCPQAENQVRSIVQQHFAGDRTITAALLRMHFHDCFVRGCDASILIDSTGVSRSEKEAGPNQTVRGFELIDKIKAALEALCPRTVSCADVITLATRDAVALAGGPAYAVPTGRRDGLVSSASEVDLPGPTVSVSGAFQAFSAKGLSLTDMVILLGAHTVGVAHCSFFQDRLTASQNGGSLSSSMDRSLAAKLRNTCSASIGDATAFLDQNTSFTVDNEFYKQILLKKGILQIDQELTGDSSTVGMVVSLARNGTMFRDSFARAMVRMASVGVLLGNVGEVRTNCRAFNRAGTQPPAIPVRPQQPPPAFRFPERRRFRFRLPGFRRIFF